MYSCDYRANKKLCAVSEKVIVLWIQAAGLSHEQKVKADLRSEGDLSEVCEWGKSQAQTLQILSAAQYTDRSATTRGNNSLLE